MTEFCVLTAVLPDYRTEFLRELDRLAPGRVQFFAGPEHIDPTVRTSVPEDLYTPVRNQLFLGRRFLRQTGAWREALAATVTVVDLNPRSLTAWALLVARGLRSRRTLVWGRVYPSKGAAARTAPVRAVMRRIASGVITYTWSERRLIEREHPDAKVWVAPNALYRSSALLAGPARTAQRTDILYVGRLEPVKKPLLLLDAFALALDRLPPHLRLVVIGDGSERRQLEARARELGIGSRTVFLGHNKDFEQLRTHYERALCSVSPGYAGLSLTQSLGFGVPMVVADDEPHAPEIELAEAGAVTWFTAGAADHLAARLVERSRVTLEPEELRKVRATTLARYTADSMAQGFLDALKGVSAMAQSVPEGISQPEEIA